jgi:predicted nucleic acid-binding protein
MIILDTNVLSALMRPSLNRSVIVWLDGQPRTSVWTTAISVMEVRFGLSIGAAGRQRDARAVEFERVIADDLQDRILPFDREAAEQTGILLAARQRGGKPRDMRDSMIAGIVLAQRATLATRNVRHFDDLNVPVVDPWQGG